MKIGVKDVQQSTMAKFVDIINVECNVIMGTYTKAIDHIKHAAIYSNHKSEIAHKHQRLLQ